VCGKVGEAVGSTGRWYRLSARRRAGTT